MTDVYGGQLTWPRLLLLLAVLCFVLAAIGVVLPPIDLYALGLALGFGSFAAPNVPLGGSDRIGQERPEPSKVQPGPQPER
jgi:hypothetical protein